MQAFYVGFLDGLRVRGYIGFLKSIKFSFYVGFLDGLGLGSKFRVSGCFGFSAQFLG